MLDTNVIVSAALWGGVPRQVLEEAYSHHELCFSLRTLQELERVFHYSKFDKRIFRLSFSIDEFLGRLLEKAIVIADPPEEVIITEDPADNTFLVCAVFCGADLVVSGNEHLLALKKYQDIPIVNSQTAKRHLFK